MTAAALEDLYKPKINADGKEDVPKGMVTRNRKLADRIEKKNKEKQDTAVNDPKKKAAQAAPAKKEEAKKDAPIPKGKTAQQVQQEMEAEEEKKRKEVEDLERQRLEEIEKNFDRDGELRRLGGSVFDFFVDDGKRVLFMV